MCVNIRTQSILYLNSTTPREVVKETRRKRSYFKTHLFTFKIYPSGILYPNRALMQYGDFNKTKSKALYFQGVRRRLYHSHYLSSFINMDIATFPYNWNIKYDI